VKNQKARGFEKPAGFDEGGNAAPGRPRPEIN
jgi:hypothetical protein